jgi:hypothetical protein
LKTAAVRPAPPGPLRKKISEISGAALSKAAPKNTSMVFTGTRSLIQLVTVKAAATAAAGAGKIQRSPAAKAVGRSMLGRISRTASSEADEPSFLKSALSIPAFMADSFRPF